jgi:hypothetical protein
VQTVGSIVRATLEEHKLELATSLLRSGGRIRIKALGTSMLPSIWPGDTLLIESTLTDELTRGDVVLVKREKRILIHRLVNRSGPRWTTRGDAMPQNDPAVAAADILGRVSAIQRGGHVITPKGRVPLLQRMLAWVLCYSQNCRRVALHIHSVRCDRSAHRTFAVALDQRGS